MPASVLILLRHAHRNTEKGRHLNNGLSKKGKHQATAFCGAFQKRFGRKVKVEIWSSPKKRCLQTLQPLAECFKAQTNVHSSLDEEQEHEIEAAFRSRVQKALSLWKKSKADVLVLCSHGDWIPYASEALVGLRISLKKGGWMEFENLREPQLTSVCQKVL